MGGPPVAHGVSTHLLAVVVGIPIGWHLAMVAGVYYDAGRTGMDRRKWAAIALLVPLFGFFAYLFERGERDHDPASDPYARGGYNVHESRADEPGLAGGSESGDGKGDGGDGGRAGGGDRERTTVGTGRRRTAGGDERRSADDDR